MFISGHYIGMGPEAQLATRLVMDILVQKVDPAPPLLSRSTLDKC